MSGLTGLLLMPVLGAILAAATLPMLLSGLRRLGHLRANFEGRPVVNSAGLAFVIPAVVAACLAPTGGQVSATMISALGFVALGLLDDTLGSREASGLAGHLGALARGRVTTGTVKAAGGVGCALLAAAQLHGGLPEAGSPPWAWAGWVVLAGALIALQANATNLLDVRPLRALKASSLLGLPLWGWAAASGVASAPALALGGVLGAAAVFAWPEARRAAMLGDAGSNLVGALLGVAAAALIPWPAQAVWVAALAALHVYCERRSLSAWIDSHPAAAAFDRWGWSDRRSW